MDSASGNVSDPWWRIRCCNDQQFQSIFLIAGYCILIFKLWRVSILHPFKILTVFLHELGHATAAWLTCGKVTSMEVHPNEGGVTSYVGGVQFIVVPAGYLGSAVWGMGLVIASAGLLSAQIAAGILIFFLLVFIYYASNAYLRWLNLGFTILLGGLLALSIWTDYNVLRYVILFMGVMSCLFSIYDIWDDLISRRVNESDASVFASMTHTSSRCWGIIWGLFALGTLGCAVYFNLVVWKNSGPLVKSISEISKGTTASLIVSCIIIFLAIVHTIFTKTCMVIFQRPQPINGDYTAA